MVPSAISPLLLVSSINSFRSYASTDSKLSKRVRTSWFGDPGLLLTRMPWLFGEELRCRRGAKNSAWECGKVY